MILITCTIGFVFLICLVALFAGLIGGHVGGGGIDDDNNNDGGGGGGGGGCPYNCYRVSNCTTGSGVDYPCQCNDGSVCRDYDNYYNSESYSEDESKVLYVLLAIVLLLLVCCCFACTAVWIFYILLWIGIIKKLSHNTPY